MVAADNLTFDLGREKDHGGVVWCISGLRYYCACELSLHIGPFHSCALLRIVRFRRESIVFPGRFLISFGFSDLLRAPASLCDHGLYHGRCLTRVNVRTTTTTNNRWYLVGRRGGKYFFWLAGKVHV